MTIKELYDWAQKRNLENSLIKIKLWNEEEYYIQERRISVYSSNINTEVNCKEIIVFL